MRHSLRMPRAAGPLAVATLALLLSSGGSPTAPSDPAPAAAAEPRFERMPAGVVPLGRLGPEGVERPMRAGEGHGWLLRLEAGDFAHVRIEQLGVDVTLTLFDPAGRFLFEIDTLTPMGYDGEEDLYFRAAATGMHRLELRAIGDREKDAGYRARLAERRPASAADLERLRAEDEFRCGTALYLARDLQAALPRLARSAERFGELGEPRRQAAARSVRCSGLYALGRHAEARPDCQAALAFFEREGPPAWQATALNNLGKVLLELDEPRGSIAAFEAALPLKEAMGDSWNLAVLHTDLGMARRQSSDFHGALTEFGLALDGWLGLDEGDRAAHVLHERGLLHRELGRIEEAAADLRRAIDLLADDDSQRPITLLALGLTLAEQGTRTQAMEPLSEALDRLLEALEIARREQDETGTARALTALGLVHATTGEPVAAVRRYREALPVAQAVGDSELVGDIFYNLARLEREGRAEGEITLYQHALAAYWQAGNREGQMQALVGLARAEQARGRLLAGLQHVRRALLIVAELRQRLRRPDLRISFMARRFDPFESAIDLLMDLHRRHPDQGWEIEALEVCELARGRGLLDLVSGFGNGAGSEAPGADSPRLAIDPAQEARPEAVLGVHAIQGQVLDPETVLLVYKLGTERSYLWAVEQDRLESFELPKRSELERLARSFHGQLAQPPRYAAATGLARTGAELSRALLCPARDRLDDRRLIVVAEGDLLYLPFAALSLATCDSAAPSEPSPLAAEHPILTVPSASTLAVLRRRPSTPRPRWRLAAIGDPVFDRCDQRVAATHRTASCRSRYRRLQHSGEEIRAIVALAPAARGATATGFEARRGPPLDRLMSESGLLHFATHVDTTVEPPRLALSGIDRDGRPLDPDHLSAAEIAEMRLAADLVVLSGCDSALGPSFQGEGLVGLAYALFQAGAGGVLVSLWPIDDRATSELMTRFYRLLLDEDQAPAAALARAQDEVRSLPRWRAPYYWAGFVLLGEGTPPVGAPIDADRSPLQ